MSNRFYLSAALLPAFSLTLTAPQLLLALDVSGAIEADTTWTPDNNPYVIIDDLTVKQGVTLDIAPDVVVEIATNATLTVYGSLMARGTPENPIILTNRPGQNRAGGLMITGVDQTNLALAVFEECHFYGLAGAGGQAGIRTQYADLRMTNCRLRDFPGGALRPVDSRLAITANIIHNTGEAINAVRCAGIIASNDISLINGYADAIDLDYAWTGPGDPTMLLLRNYLADAAHADADAIDFGTSPGIAEGNIIRNFGDKGISIGERSPAKVFNNLIMRCAIGIAIKDGSQPVLQHNTIVNCGYGILSFQKTFGMGGGKGSLTNSIVWNCGVSISLENNSTLDVSHCCIQGAELWPGENNLNADPQFRDPENYDFRLLPGSPCIDTGADLDWMTDFADLEGNPRVSGERPDMGAYEFTVGGLLCNPVGVPLSSTIPLEVTLTAFTAGTNTEGLVYFWDVDGDGVEDFAGPAYPVVTGKYERAGRYTISLTVTNAVGEIATTTKRDYVTVRGPAIAYVVPSGAPRYPYESWETAATNIQDAVDVGLDGTLVLVSDGVYRVQNPIQISEAVIVRSVNGAGSTVVNGGNVSRCFTLSHTGAVVEGFTITGGRDARGGGVFLDAMGTVRNCRIRANHATRGGGVYCNGGGTIIACDVVENVADDRGGGAFLAQGGELHSCLLADNTVRSGGNGDGGGAHCQQGGLLRNCVVSGNCVADRGGGVFCESGGLVENCTIVGNTATNTGGGVRCYYGGTLRNCIIYFNSAPNGQSPNFDDAGSSPSYSYCCTWPLHSGQGNVSSDPMLLAVGDGDYRLARGSPCIDAGTNVAWMTSAFDIAGVSRVRNGTVDMGAYESEYLGCRFSASPCSGLEPLTARFTAETDGSNTTALTYGWDINGDGTDDYEGPDLSAISHEYRAAGVYTVALSVSNAAGETAKSVRPAYIMVVPATMYVATNGGHRQPFADWETAATSLSAAVQLACNGCEILVGRGLYRLSAPVILTNGITLRSASGSSETILDGGRSNRCIEIGHELAVIDGFTITRGRAQDGGGVYCRGAGLIQNCVIVSNVAVGRGGGVFLDRGGWLRNCDILSNTSSADDAGGVFCNLGGEVEKCRFVGNHAGDDGGALQCNSGGIARACYFYGNTATDKGGGAFCWSDGTLVNCVFAGNSARDGGGLGIYGGGLTLNCTIVSNRATQTGGGVYSTNGGTLVNTVIYFNSASRANNFTNTGVQAVYHSCCSVPRPPGEANITGNPLFVDPANGNFRLQSGSSCIDGGSFSLFPEHDFDGIPRPLDGDLDGAAAPDIGAFEMLVPLADSDGDAMPDGWELAHGLSPVLSYGNDGAAGDPDGDGFPNLSEYIADTDPTDGRSLLAIKEVQLLGTGVLVSWQGGTGAWQFVESGENLSATGSNWMVIFTNSPPTGTEAHTTDSRKHGRTQFYRLRAVR